MKYFGKTAMYILNKNLHDNVNLFAKGYFKEGGYWIAFDNYTGNCFVEQFATEAKAIAWIEGYFEMSEVNEFEIFKLAKTFYYIKGKGFLMVKFNNHVVYTKLLRFPLNRVC